MRALKPLLLLVVLAVAALLWGRHTSEPTPPGSVVSQTATAPSAERTRSDSLPSFLPPEAADILRRIASGGPYEHRQDGVVFQNREGRLPAKPEPDAEQSKHDPCYRDLSAAHAEHRSPQRP